MTRSRQESGVREIRLRRSMRRGLETDSRWASRQSSTRPQRVTLSGWAPVHSRIVTRPFWANDPDRNRTIAERIALESAHNLSLTRALACSCAASLTIVRWIGVGEGVPLPRTSRRCDISKRRDIPQRCSRFPPLNRLPVVDPIIARPLILMNFILAVH